MTDKKIRLAITHGDINGVGYEVILKTFSDSRMMEFCTPVLYGSSKVASYHKKLLAKQDNLVLIIYVILML
jgi:4-hydroxythreonine-4-phosphate dehydrogenase